MATLLYRLGRAAYRRARTVLVVWLLAAIGLLNPIIAAAAMALSSLSVIVNSAALKRLRMEVRP